MPSGNAHMYRQLNGRRLLTGMVLAILTLGLIVIDLGMGSSGIGPGEVVDALLGGPDGDTANTAILWSIRLPMTLTCVLWELAQPCRLQSRPLPTTLWRAPILSALRQAPVLERP